MKSLRMRMRENASKQEERKHQRRQVVGMELGKDKTQEGRDKLRSMERVCERNEMRRQSCKYLPLLD